MKPQFFSGNAVQSLSHVLALGDGRAEEKCSRTLLLYDRLKERGYKYGTDYELPTLGVLALSEGDLMEIVTEMTDTDDFLAKQKGLGNWSIGRKQRLMYTGMLVQGEYVKAGSLETAAINGTISMIVAQQAAMCAAVAASTGSRRLQFLLISQIPPSNGESNLKRCERRYLTSRGSRQRDVRVHHLGSLIAEIKRKEKVYGNYHQTGAPGRVLGDGIYD